MRIKNSTAAVARAASVLRQWCDRPAPVNEQCPRALPGAEGEPYDRPRSDLRFDQAGRNPAGRRVKTALGWRGPIKGWATAKPAACI